MTDEFYFFINNSSNWNYNPFINTPNADPYILKRARGHVLQETASPNLVYPQPRLYYRLVISSRCFYPHPLLVRDTQLFSRDTGWLVQAQPPAQRGSGAYRGQAGHVFDEDMGGHVLFWVPFWFITAVPF